VYIYLHLFDNHKVDATAKAARTPAASEVAPQVVSTSSAVFPQASEATQVFLRSGGAVAHLFPSPHPLPSASGSHAAPLVAAQVVLAVSGLTTVSQSDDGTHVSFLVGGAVAQLYLSAHPVPLAESHLVGAGLSEAH